MLRNALSMTGLSALKSGTSVLVSMLIARQLGPGEFGLVAFSISLMAFITLLTDLGLSGAIVRHDELSRSDAGAVFGLMLAAGLLGCLLLIAASNISDRWLNLPGIGRVLTGYGVVTLLSIWAGTPRALLERRLAYPQIAIIESVALCAAVAAFAVGLEMSLGVMALISYHVTFQGIRSALFTFAARAQFSINRNFSAIMGLLRVGGALLLSNLLSYSARNLDNLLIGGILGAASLGLYSLAYQFMTLPLVMLAWPVSGVLLSTLARLDKRAPDMKAEVICATVAATALIIFPMMVFVALALRTPIELLYAGRWNGLTDIIALLAPVGALQSVAVYNGAVLVQKGAIRLNFLLSLFNGLTISAVFLASIWFGLNTLIVSYVVATSIVCAVLIYFMCREAGIGAGRFLFCLVPGGAAAAIGAGLTAVTVGFETHTLNQWLLSVVIYSFGVLAVYAVLSRQILRFIAVFRRSAHSAIALQGAGL